MDLEKRNVRKSNNLVNGKYRFGLIEQKILLSIISKIKISDKEFSPYRISWSQIKILTRGKVRTKKGIAAICEKLKQRTIEIKEGTATNYFGLLSGWKISPGRWVEFRIDPVMKDMLLDLLEVGNFTLYQLENILPLSSTYSIRMYEILKSHEWQGSFEMSLADLRFALDAENKYKSFSTFRLRVLDKAQKDMKSTDINFTYKKVTVLREVDSLVFTVTKNKTFKSIVQKKDITVAREGDKVIFNGKSYEIEGGCIRLPDGPLPIGRVNQLIKKGVIKL